MSETAEHKSWWVTLPGILTQLAALITAVTGLVAALYQTGFIGHRGESPAHDAPPAPSRPEAMATALPASLEAPHVSTPAMPAPATAPTAPPKGTFTITIGNTISDGVPAPGAGRIESPGSEDRYQFTAARNQRVYFRMLEHGPDMSQIKWRLTDANDQVVFDTCLGCGDPGVQTLSLGGTYALTVGNPGDPATGPYKLRLTDVPAASRFDIQPNIRISDGMPGRGAGMIETPGASDEYVFSAAAGQRVYFRMREHGPSMSQIKWRLTDANDQAVFDTCLGCGDPGLQTLTRGGVYVLAVGNPRDPATGAYRIDLSTP